MTRVAAVDCGTNSIRLLIADVSAGDATGPATPRLTDIVREMRVVRLGQGVDSTGELAQEALERTFAATRDYAALIREHGAEKVRFVATSATRDARNRQVFVDGIRDILGVEPEVITGDEEAALSFAGASSVLPSRGQDPVLVVDLGGGSTEFVLGNAGGVIAARSVDVGCVRMTERHFGGAELPTDDQIARAKADILAALDTAAETVPLTEAATLVGLAGTVTTVAGIALDLPEYDSVKIHHARLSVAQVRETAGRLLHATHAERLAIPVMHPGRADVIAAGALVLLEIMERTGAAEVVVSEHDILDGIAWSIAR